MVGLKMAVVLRVMIVRREHILFRSWIYFTNAKQHYIA